MGHFFIIQKCFRRLSPKNVRCFFKPVNHSNQALASGQGSQQYKK